jgi:O-antigen/teichoic acid export membrane protein
MRQLLRDGAIYAGAAVATRGLALLLVPLYTRILTPGEYGALDLIVTLGVLANIVVALEVSQGMAREWASEADAIVRRRMAGTALIFTMGTNGLFLALALPFSGILATHWLTHPAYAVAMLAGFVYMAFNALFLQLQGQFRWDLRPRAYALVSALFAGLTLLLGAGMGEMLGLVGVLAGQGLAAALAAFASLWLLRSNLVWKFDRVQLVRMLRFSLPLVPAGLAVFVSFHVNRLLLNALGTLDEVGVFSVASRLAGVSALLIVGLQGALTPLVYVHHREPWVPAQLARLFEGFVALALLICLLMSLFSRELVAVFAAPGYASAATLLAVLAPATLLAQMYIFAPGIAIERRTTWQLAIATASAAVSIALNAWLIPQWGPLGAAAATLASSAAFFGLWLTVSQRLYRLPLRAMPLTLALVAYGLLVWLGNGIDSIAWSEPATRSAKLACAASFAAMMWSIGLLRSSAYAGPDGPVGEPRASA